MLTKSYRKKAETSTPVVHFYLAEDLRQELDGKVSAIGLYPDKVVVLPLPDEIPEPTESAPLLVRSLAFLFSISNLSEISTISVDIQTDRARMPLTTPQEHPAVEVGRSINMVGVMQPCVITSFGEKTLIVKINEREYTFDFEIRRVSVPSAGVTQLPNIEVSSTKNRRTRKKPTNAK